VAADCRARSWAASETGCGARGQQRPDDEAQGARPDFSRWATQGNRKGEEKKMEKVFFSFFEKGNQTKFKHRFEFNNQK
jgi:hypothetical protein